MSSETKFTPGPWVASNRAVAAGMGGRCYGSFVSIPGASGFVVRHHSISYPVIGRGTRSETCHYIESEAVPCEEQKKCINGIHPDAHLIAAAPDLYAALETLIEKLCIDDDEGLIEYAEPMIAARAALAKARGEGAR